MEICSIELEMHNKLFYASYGGVIDHVQHFNEGLNKKWGLSPLASYVLAMQVHEDFLYCCGKGWTGNVCRIWIRPPIFVNNDARPKIEVPLTPNSRQNKIPFRRMWHTQVENYTHNLYAIDVDNNGNIYVVGDFINSKNIWKLDTTGKRLASYLEGISSLLRGVVCDITGNVFVCGTRVSSKSVWKLGGWGADTGADARDISVDEFGNVYVAGVRNNNKSWWKFDSSGTLVLSGDTGANTNAIEVDADGNIYTGGSIVYAPGVKHLWKFNNLGVEQWKIGASPYYLVKTALDRAGAYIYFCSDHGYLSKIRTSDGNVDISTVPGNDISHDVTINEVPILS